MTVSFENTGFRWIAGKNMQTCDYLFLACLNSDQNVFPCHVTHYDTGVFEVSKMSNGELTATWKNDFPNSEPLSQAVIPYPCFLPG